MSLLIPRPFDGQSILSRTRELLSVVRFSFDWRETLVLCDNTASVLPGRERIGIGNHVTLDAEIVGAS